MSGLFPQHCNSRCGVVVKLIHSSSRIKRFSRSGLRRSRGECMAENFERQLSTGAQGRGARRPSTVVDRRVEHERRRPGSRVP